MTARLTTNRIWQLSHGLTPRDLAVVETLARVRVASAWQLERLHFPSQARTARRVLAELAERRIVVRLNRRVGGVRAGSAGHVYALDVVGQQLSQRGGPAGGERLRRPWTPGSRFLGHALAVSEVYVILGEQARADAFELLRFEGEPDCWRTFTYLGVPVTLKPDGFVRLGLRDEEAWFFIEVDRGTESVRTIETKAELYRSYWESGEEQDRHGIFPEVVWLVPDERRGVEVEGAVTRARCEALSTTVLENRLLDVISPAAHPEADAQEGGRDDG